MKRTFLNFGLLSLAACQSACSFSDYPAIQGKVKEYYSIIYFHNANFHHGFSETDDNHFESVLPYYTIF